MVKFKGCQLWFGTFCIRCPSLRQLTSANKYQEIVQPELKAPKLHLPILQYNNSKWMPMFKVLRWYYNLFSSQVVRDNRFSVCVWRAKASCQKLGLRDLWFLVGCKLRSLGWTPKGTLRVWIRREGAQAGHNVDVWRAGMKTRWKWRFLVPCECDLAESALWLQLVPLPQNQLALL